MNLKQVNEYKSLDENKDVIKCLYCVTFFDIEFFKH